MASIYTEARRGVGIDWASAARAGNILQIIAKLLEGGDLERRLDAIEQRLNHAAERQTGGKSNGHAHSREIRP